MTRTLSLSLSLTLNLTLTLTLTLTCTCTSSTGAPRARARRSGSAHVSSQLATTRLPPCARRSHACLGVAARVPEIAEAWLRSLHPPISPYISLHLGVAVRVDEERRAAAAERAAVQRRLRLRAVGP